MELIINPRIKYSMKVVGQSLQSVVSGPFSSGGEGHVTLVDNNFLLYCHITGFIGYKPYATFV